MKQLQKKRFFSFLITLGCSAGLFYSSLFTVHAEVIDYAARAESYKLLPVESNAIKDWPQGPAVSAKSAILMEANTGTILYAKNIHEPLFPASTTKILTAYIARQKSSLDEMVEYSSEAVNSINWREDSNIGIKAGEAITMEQSLYGLMVGSANECGNAIGEHISGSMEAFAELMNQTAKELGCTDSNFVTTNGIHDDAHVTSAHDLALIAQKYFEDELLCKMSGTPSYVIPASATLSQELIPNSKNKLLPTRKYAYEYLIGSKTGYTGQARQNLVSCAEKDGLKLICVVMSDEAPMQYTDTIDLFEYGFSNFSAVNAAEHDTTYNINQGSFFSTDNAIFGDAAPILAIDQTATLILPSNASFEDLTSSLSYEDLAEGQAAVVHYTYNDQPVGSAPILLSGHAKGFDFGADAAADEGGQTASLMSAAGTAADGTDSTAETDSTTEAASTSETAGTAETANATEAAAASSASVQAAKPSNDNIVFLNIKKVMFVVLGVFLVVLVILIVRSVIHDRNLTRRRRAIMKRRRDRKDEIIDFDRYIDHF